MKINIIILNFLSLAFILSVNSSYAQTPDKQLDVFVELLEKECSQKDGKACSLLGYTYDKGISVKRDYLKASHYYQEACDLNEGQECNMLGFMYLMGTGVQLDTQKCCLYTKIV